VLHDTELSSYVSDGLVVASDLSATAAIQQVQLGVAAKVQSLYNAYRDPNNPAPYDLPAIQ
jgi:hypothetical protein